MPAPVKELARALEEELSRRTHRRMGGILLGITLGIIGLAIGESIGVHFGRWSLQGALVEIPAQVGLVIALYAWFAPSRELVKAVEDLAASDDLDVMKPLTRSLDINWPPARCAAILALADLVPRLYQAGQERDAKKATYSVLFKIGELGPHGFRTTFSNPESAARILHWLADYGDHRVVKLVENLATGGNAQPNPARIRALAQEVLPHLRERVQVQAKRVAARRTAE